MNAVIPRSRALLASAAVVALDQLSKAVVLAQLSPGQRINVLPFFDWTLVFNPGAAFSFLAQASGWQRWFFLALAAAVSLWCWWALGRERDGRVRLALVLILAGAVGNAIDRLWLGQVVDFILLYWAPWNFYYPAFNIADSAITLGAVLLVWAALWPRDNVSASRRSDLA
ncbi:MAG: signal peptidase II [Casimicrobiaceae bacterium]|nr:signal peptidase II [Casimicrobiaceae bacterium]MCX8098000.1 signal peptidase II [Casimicrobiaceae bacterium]MDW8311705.1 signal peptidase II [Burkholderiales bacterium]